MLTHYWATSLYLVLILCDLDSKFFLYIQAQNGLLKPMLLEDVEQPLSVFSYCALLPKCKLQIQPFLYVLKRTFKILLYNRVTYLDFRF